MRAAEGEEFDQIYIDRLRAAHGKIFPAIATIRTSTRNDTVRKLAQRANQFVMTHLTLLESSDLVDFAALPTAPPPNAPPANLVSAPEQSQPYAVSLPVVLLVLVCGIGVALFITWRLMRDPRRNRRRYRSRAYEY
jgi:putative membrane protein